MHIKSLALFALVTMTSLSTVSAQQPTAPTLPTAGNANGAPPYQRPIGPDGKPIGAEPVDVVARGPSIALAEIAAKAIVASCKGYHVGIAILDAAGTPKLYYIPDGTAGTHAYTGYRKANTALAFKMPSEQAALLAKTDATVAARFKAQADNYIGWAGGIPITVDGEVIGAIGVSGAEPSAKDEACAVNGLNTIKSRLK